jgi:hypothetical protein
MRTIPPDPRYNCRIPVARPDPRFDFKALRFGTRLIPAPGLVPEYWHFRGPIPR